MRTVRPIKWRIVLPVLSVLVAVGAVVLVLSRTSQDDQLEPEWKIRMARDVPMDSIPEDSWVKGETRDTVLWIRNDLLRQDSWNQDDVDEILRLSLLISIDYLIPEEPLPFGDEKNKYTIATTARWTIVTRLEFGAPIKAPQRQRLLKFIDSWIDSVDHYTRMDAINAFFRLGLLDDPYYMGRVEAMEDDPDPWVVATSRRVRRWREQGVGPYKHIVEDKAGQP